MLSLLLGWTKTYRKYLKFWATVFAIVLLIKGCGIQSLRPSLQQVQADVIEQDVIEQEDTSATAYPVPYPEFIVEVGNSPEPLPDFVPPRDTFGDRAQQLIEYHATHPPNRDRDADPTGYVKSAVYTAMALYASGKMDDANRMADYLFTNPHGGSMFLAMAGMDLYMRYNSYMPQDLRDKARRFVTNFDNYTGGTTENHGIMFATAGYLASQEWPDWNRAEAVREQTQAHLFDFIEGMAEHGIIEHDSPIYHVFFVNSLLSLHDHATDPEMQQKATIGLELLLTSMAPEWLQGYWASSTLRTASFNHDPRRNGSLTGKVGWLYWGGSEMPLPDDGCAVMSAVSDYRIPDVLQSIGQDRRLPYVHRETQGRDFNRGDKFRKYTYMDRNYAMYSQFDGNGELAWSDQMNRMGVVWVSEFPGSALVIKHPVDNRARGDTKDGQVLQHERALIGVYQDTVDGYVPATNAVVDQIEDDGWLFLHGGTALVGVKVINGSTWENSVDVLGTEFKRFHSDADRNGVVIQTAPVEDFSGDSPRAVLETFANAVKTQTHIDASRVNTDRPQLRFESLSGDVLEMEFSGDRTINGTVIDYSTWPLVENPWMRSEVGKWLEMRYGDRTRFYDFEDWSISSDTP